MTTEKIVESVISWINSTEAIEKGKVVRANRNTKLPSAPFAVVDVIGGPDRLATGRRVYNDTTDYFDYVVPVLYTVQVSIYADNSEYLAAKILSSISSMRTRSILKANNIDSVGTLDFGIINDGRVENVNYIQRSILEIRLKTDLTYQESDELIEIVSLETEDQTYTIE